MNIFTGIRTLQAITHLVFGDSMRPWTFARAGLNSLTWPSSGYPSDIPHNNLYPDGIAKRDRTGVDQAATEALKQKRRRLL